MLRRVRAGPRRRCIMGPELDCGNYKSHDPATLTATPLLQQPPPLMSPPLPSALHLFYKVQDLFGASADLD